MIRRRSFGVLMIILWGVFLGSLFIAISSVNKKIYYIAAANSKMQDTIREEWDIAINDALMHAPQDKTRWQFRGDAQTYAQMQMDNLTHALNIIPVELSAINWTTFGDGAAAKTRCNITARRPTILMDEILFLRNYREYMRMVISHEVAHAAVCVKYGEIRKDSHGNKWTEMMHILGFTHAHDEIKHHMDYSPVSSFYQKLRDQGISVEIIVDNL